MKRKYIMTYLFEVLLVCVTLVAVNAQSQNTPDRLPKGAEKFDVDGDGKLSEAEKETMLEAITIEVFTGQTFTAQDIRGRQQERRFGGGPGFGGRRGPRPREELVDRFDADDNGKLNDTERHAARSYIQEFRGEIAPSRPSGQTSPNTTVEDNLQASEAEKPPGNPDLYDEKTLRTFYLRFHAENWYEQLGDFYRTDVDVPADFIVDGKVYPSVGVRFRGSSSYFAIQHAEKKSFNISIDYGDDDQRLYGYKTLNLLNGHSDPSFLREVLYSKIARNYIPAPKANFVKLVINGEDWGIYINSQQFNKDFLDEWFGTKKGVRWKVPPGRNSGLVYNGEDPANYQRAYQLKTNLEDASSAWSDLINLCETLDNAPDNQLEAVLKPIFNIDRALWFIALENVFIDNDGYISRASDYAIYQDATGRFHLLPYDSNETFRFAGGGGPNSWETDGPMLSPVAQANDEMRPVISRLLAIPHLRARYLAHIRTIANAWLDWDRLYPMIREYQLLIDAGVKADDKKLYSYAAFASSHIKDMSRGNGFGPPTGFRGGRGGRGPRVTPSFRRFVDERREFLFNHPELNRPAPTIQSISAPSNPLANQPVQITAEIEDDVTLDSVILYYAIGRLSLFEAVSMSKNEEGYVREIPPVPAGTEVRYYVEARAVESHGTTTFSPARAEFGALTYRVAAPIAEYSAVVINELMANNAESFTDPQGDHDDWIELYNKSTATVDLSGMYLSDNQGNPRKWQFPENTEIAPGGYLIVWADEDGEDQPGLHANFKLSKNGETV
ncbi:MAG: CotH kinase family protein, partial [Candidatus Poribacteria bacterium]|nr:CotH kinase family protein [Candidatus Poribacteria bacterium]